MSGRNFNSKRGPSCAWCGHHRAPGAEPFKFRIKGTLQPVCDKCAEQHAAHVEPSNMATAREVL
jgi:ribosome-binding protein aMBF1 (putative translation factor)